MSFVRLYVFNIVKNCPDYLQFGNIKWPELMTSHQNLPERRKAVLETSIVVGLTFDSTQINRFNKLKIEFENIYQFGIKSLKFTCRGPFSVD